LWVLIIEHLNLILCELFTNDSRIDIDWIKTNIQEFLLSVDVSYFVLAEDSSVQCVLINEDSGLVTLTIRVLLAIKRSSAVAKQHFGLARVYKTKSLDL
jgi:hypothetical protein